MNPIHWTPAVDAWEDDDRLVLSLDMPGVARDAIEIDVEDGRMCIRFERRPQAAGDVRYRRRERTHGAFERTFVLPDTVDAGRADASYRDGVLTVTVPRAESARPRRVRVRAA